MPRQKPHALIAFSALALASMLVGCAAGTSQPKQEVRAVIAEYNRLLIEGYRTRNMSALSRVATDNQAYTEYVHMSSLAEAGRTMESTQTAIKFLSINVSAEESAIVRTREVWIYHQIDSSGRMVVPQTEVVYELTYELAKAEGAWKVNWVFETANPRRPAEEQRPEPPGEAP
jgi:5-carboxymethyl-2-hydroxymuconate isomerase